MTTPEAEAREPLCAAKALLRNHPEDCLYCGRIATALRRAAEEAEVRAFGDRGETIEWIGVVRDELVLAGYPGGDRDVALSSLRALIKGRAALIAERDAAITQHAEVAEDCRLLTESRAELVAIVEAAIRMRRAPVGPDGLEAVTAFDMAVLGFSR